MEPTTPGIVLRLHPFSETSLIVRWLTPEHGRMATLARGARRPKSPLRGRLDLFYEADFTFVPSRRSTLHTLKEASLRQTFPGLRRNYTALTHASWAARLVEHTTETDTPLPGLYSVFRDFLRLASRDPESTAPVLALELRLLDWSGLAPSPQSPGLPANAGSLVDQLLTAPWLELAARCPDSPALRQVDRWLGQTLRNQWDLPISLRPETWSASP